MFHKEWRMFSYQPKFILYRLSHAIISGAKKKTKGKKQKLHNENEVVKYIGKNMEKPGKQHTQKPVLNLDKNRILHDLQTNHSQVLGFNLEELERRVNVFKSLGVIFNDCVVLALSIPSCLNICNGNFKKIIAILKHYKLPAEEIIFKYPHIGALDHRQVKRNLELLTDELVIKSELPILVLKNPILLSYVLNKHTVELLKGSSFNLDSTYTTVANLNLSLQEKAVINSTVEKFITHNENPNMYNSEAKNFLSTYDVNPDQVYATCPEFFLVSLETLEKCCDNLSAAPFFFSAEDIQKLLTTSPEVFISFHNDDVLKQSRYIASVSTTKCRAYKLLRDYPEIFKDSDFFFKRVAMFEKYGIKEGDMGRLLAQKGGTNCFVDCEDFSDTSMTNLLEFYVSKSDLTPLQIVVSAPVSLSMKSTNIIKARLSYLRHKNKVTVIAGKKKKKQSQITIQSVVRKDLEEFVEKVCGATMSEYDEYCKSNNLKNHRAAYQSQTL